MSAAGPMGQPGRVMDSLVPTGSVPQCVKVQFLSVLLGRKPRFNPLSKVSLKYAFVKANLDVAVTSSGIYMDRLFE